MSTQITNKQVKVITDANFNNNKIVNAKIDASENEITGVSTELYAGNNISIDGATISAIVPTKVSELDNDSQYITNVVDDLVNYTTTVNLANVALSGSYNDLINKPLIDSELSDSSTNAVQNKVITNALNKKLDFPTMITNSGSSLPSASDYQVNDTFLNTSDKKIYTAEINVEGYDLNTNITNDGITVDSQTGIASGFSPSGGGSSVPKGIRRSNLNIFWESPITIDFHLKITEVRNNQVIANLYQGAGIYKDVIFYIGNDNKLYCTYTQGSYGPGTQSGIYLLANYQLTLNTEYFIRINKNGTSITTTISTQGYDTSVIYTATINDIEDWYPSIAGTSTFIYGYYNSGPLEGGNSVFSGDIYLADSSGDFLVPTGSMSWNNGITLTDKTEYIDKTNSISYLYYNNTLFSNVPSFSKITGQPTDNINLANELTRIENLTITNSSNIILETSNRQTADNNLQQQIDAITAASDVTDIVGTHAQLESYDTSTLANNSIIKVLQDETQNNETTYYRWVITNNVGAWVLIGEEGPYYTKSQADEMFVPQIRTINGIGLSNNITLTKSNIGLGNVDNTSDMNKPISTATQNALNTKQDLLPSQSGQNGKFLTTNGASLSWAEVQGGGSSYIAGAGIDEEELAENNKIALKTNWVFRNNLYINENSSIPSNKITIDNDIFFEYVNYPDNIFISFQYDGTNWKVNDNIVDLEDYGITIDSSYSLSSDDDFIVAGNYIANKNEFEIMFLEFANVFLNGLLLCENIDYTLETTEMGIKITFIDYTLKSTDRIQVL